MPVDRNDFPASQFAATGELAPAPVHPSRPVLVTALLAGIGLLWPLPLGGVLLMVGAGFALAVFSEPEPIAAVGPPGATEPPKGQPARAPADDSK